MYRKQSGQWVRVGGNLEGHGLAAVYSGDSTPDPAVGQNGDIWIPDTPVPFGGGLTDVPMSFTGNNPIAGVPYGVIVEAAGTNHVTNPSFEVDAAGWVIDGGGTLTRITSDALIGSACGAFQLVAGAVYQSVSATSAPAAAPGQAWSSSMWVKAGNATAVGKTIRVFTGPRNSTGGYIAPAGSTATKIVLTNEWQRVVHTATMPANTASVFIGLDNESADLGTSLVLFEGVQLEQAAHLSTYIDGSLGPGYAWSGAAHASTSTRTSGTKILSNKARLNVTELQVGVVTPSSASARPLVVRGAASQSANLQEWQDSAGALRVIVRAGGQMAITPDANANSTGLFIAGGAPGAVKLEVRGAASQTASLLEFQNSAGNVLSWVGAGGGFVIGGAGATGAYSSPNAYLNVQTRAPGNPGLTIRGAVSQTANLVEFQRSDGLNLVVVDMESTVTAMLSSLILNLGNIGLRRIEVGAVDSAGAGYRTVRVAN